MKNKIFFLTSGIILLAGFSLSAYASTEVTGGCCDTYARLVSPAPPSSEKPAYLLGEEIRFAGSFSATRSNSGLFFNKIKVYVTEDKDAPLVDCCGETQDNCAIEINCLCPQGCLNAYGAQSDYLELNEIENARWCDQVKDVSQQDPSFRFHKLGEIYPSDSPRNRKPYAAEYDQSFIIPEDLPFSGQVRFYIIYSGVHEKGHWHWSATYQEGYIARPPTIKNMWEDWNYADAPLQPILNWDYHSRDNNPQIAYQIALGEERSISRPLLKTDIISSPTHSYGLPPNILGWNTRYYWQVRVQDDYGQWSSWSSPASFATLIHAYPSVSFDWTPKPIHAQAKTEFIDLTSTYGGSHIINRHWTFRDRVTGDTITTSTAARPAITFREKGYLAATLTVTDSSGYSTSRTRNFEVFYPLPEEGISPAPF